MELKEAIKNRTSVRSFITEPIELEDLKTMIRHAGFAPSVNNFQPWKFVLVMNENVMQKMASAVSEKIANLPLKHSKAAKNLKSQVAWYSTFFQDAPAIIIIASKSYETVLESAVQLTHDQINQLRNYPDIQSIGACVQNILLTAVDLGYGACWLSGPLIASKEIEELLNIQNPWKIQTIVAVGRSPETSRKKNRKDFSEELEIIQ